MRTVSAEFKALWQAKVLGGDTGRERRRIVYYRRYENAAGAFVNEAAPQYLYEDDFVAWGEIPWELDRPFENVYRTGIVTLQLANERNQWVQSDGSPSVFAADATAPDGYKLFRTLFQLQVGYELADGTTEWVTEFTGYALKPTLSSSKGVASIRVASKSAFLLEKSQASEVCTVVTLESCSPATGDGTRVAFKTVSTGVGRIDEVQVNAAARPLSDYVIGNLNVVASPDNDGAATITFDDAPGIPPGNTHTVKWSGIKWLEDQAIDDLLGAVADNAGIPGADQLLDAVILPGSATAFKQIDTQAEWEAGSVLTYINTKDTPGSISIRGLFDRFDDNDYTSSPVWTANAAHWSAASGALKKTSNAVPTSYATVPSTLAVGQWEADITCEHANSATIWSFMAQDTTLQNGYYISTGFGVVQLYQIVGNVPTQLGTSAVAITVGQAYAFKITRSAGGEIKVYRDGTLLITATNAAFSTSVYMVCADTQQLSTFDNFYQTPPSAPYESQSFDLLTPPSEWGTLDRIETLNGGTITYATAVSSDGVTWDAYVDISAGGAIQSALKRYLKIRATIACAAGSFTSPLCHKLTANFSTDDVFVSLAILDGMTGAEAFERYAALVDYETGDNPDGKRFLRSKVVSGSPAVELTQENGIIEVLEWDPGTDDVKTVGEVRFGDYVEQYDSSDAGEPEVEDEYGRAVAELDLTGTLLANDVNLAATRAQLLYERSSRARRRVRLTIWAVPWLELGDKVRLTVLDDPLLARNTAHDPLPRAASGRALSGGAFDVCLANGLDCKVLQYKPNFDTNRAELYAEEILA